MKIRRGRNQIKKIQFESQEVKGVEEQKKHPISTLKTYFQPMKKWLKVNTS